MEEVIKLEELERKILHILETNARMSTQDIAKMVGSDVTEVEKIIKKLEDSGIIIGYHAHIDWDRTDENVVYAFIDVKVVPERDVGFDRIAKRIYEFPQVHSLYLLSGTYDLGVVVKGKDMREVAYFVAEHLATLERVQSTVTHFVLKTYKLDGKVASRIEKNHREVLTP